MSIVARLDVVATFRRIYGLVQISLNPFTPTSDRDRISPHDINTISSRQVVRIERNINHGIISGSKTKFSELTS